MDALFLGPPAGASRTSTCGEVLAEWEEIPFTDRRGLNTTSCRDSVTRSWSQLWPLVRRCGIQTSVIQSLAHLLVYTHARTHAYTHTHTLVLQTHTHMHKTHAHTHTHTHTHTHSDFHKHTHTSQSHTTSVHTFTHNYAHLSAIHRAHIHHCTHTPLHSLRPRVTPNVPETERGAYSCNEGDESRMETTRRDYGAYKEQQRAP